LDSEPPVSLFAQLLNPVDFATLAPAFLAIVILLAFSGLVSGAEVSFFSLSSPQLDLLKASKKKADLRIVELLNKPRQLLATILISNNFVNVGIVILSTFVVHQIFNFAENPIAAFAIEIVAVTSLILLFGEVLPKIYATTAPLVLARFMAKPLAITQKLFLFLQLIPVLIAISKKLERPAKNDGLTVDDLEHALELTENSGTNVEEHKILEGIVRFGNTTVRQIMTPRTNMQALEVTSDFKAVLKNIIDFGFSRIPVYEDNIDQIKGIIYIKDLLPYLNASPDFAWTKLMREPFYVPESKKIDDLLAEFQEMKMHLAVVVDEFGGTSGLVSLEDIIEEIVGEISDEFDSEELVFSKLDNQNYVFEGRTPLAEFYRVLDIEGEDFEEQKGDADTLAGFILEISGKFPERNAVIPFADYTFKIENIEERRIQRIKVTLPTVGE
jgi:gliding motility-associated protein GldE